MVNNGFVQKADKPKHVVSSLSSFTKVLGDNLFTSALLSSSALLLLLEYAPDLFQLHKLKLLPNSSSQMSFSPSGFGVRTLFSNSLIAFRQC
jgi:hypothetical protein